MSMYRQGDVLLVRVRDSAIDKGKVLSNGESIVVHVGEKHGHEHVAIAIDDLEIREAHMEKYIVSKSGFQLQHPEHSTLDLEPGKYQIVTQQEWVDPTTTRNVAD